MTNLPSRVGERYLCFEVIKRGKGWSGSYGQTWSGPTWRCVECGYEMRETWGGLDQRRAAEHHECSHAPCRFCGQVLLKRKDGSEREHSHHQCPGKSGGHKIEREYVKNIGARELPKPLVPQPNPSEKR